MGEESRRHHFLKGLLSCVSQRQQSIVSAQGSPRQPVSISQEESFHLEMKHKPTESISFHQIGITTRGCLSVRQTCSPASFVRRDCNRLAMLHLSWRRAAFLALVLSALPWNLDQQANRPREKLSLGCYRATDDICDQCECLLVHSCKRCRI